MNPKSLPKPKLCVFDLDGTLVDSLLDVAGALDYGLDLLGLPLRSPDDCRYLVGEGIPRLCARAIGDAHPHLVPRLCELVRARYRTRAVVHTRPYPGICELTDRLRQQGIRIAVLSNKPHELTLRVVHAFWSPGDFAALYGYIEDEYRKPSPHYLLRICREVGVAPHDTWLIGDTPTDIQTARAAGAGSVGVTWGFRSREDLVQAGATHIVDTPEQLP